VVAGRYHGSKALGGRELMALPIYIQPPMLGLLKRLTIDWCEHSDRDARPLVYALYSFVFDGSLRKITQLIGLASIITGSIELDGFVQR